MTAIAIALAVVLLAALLTFERTVRSMQRAHTRREDLLLNQLLNLAGKPWLPAPADGRPARPEKDPEAPRFTQTPEAFVGGMSLPDLPPLESFDLPTLIPADWTEAQ